MGINTITALADLISTNVAKIKQTCLVHEIDFPSLDEPFAIDRNDPWQHSEILGAAEYIIAAASQLIATVRSTAATLQTVAVQFHTSSALRVAVESNVVEILRDAGPQGLHVDKIAETSKIDSAKIARILRLLATQHIFKEIYPDTFANNRLSAAIDTGKSVQEIITWPDKKYAGTSGVAAMLSHFTDEVLKSSAFLADHLLGKSGNTVEADATPYLTPFNLAFQTRHSVWDWFEEAGNEARLTRFGIAYEGASNMYPPESMLSGFQWDNLQPTSLVVDVGGGIGSYSLILAKRYPHIKFVVQDRKDAIENGKQFWREQLPDALNTHRVQFQEHDFFTEQPVRDATVYILRMILHDWTDTACIHILKNLRSAASLSSRLLIIDNIISYACEDTKLPSIPGAEQNPYPYPLLPNLGHANVFHYLIDIQMMVLLNGQERTLSQLQNLLREAGWELQRVNRAPRTSSAHHQVEALPIPIESYNT